MPGAVSEEDLWAIPSAAGMCGFGSECTGKKVFYLLPEIESYFPCEVMADAGF